MTWNAPEPVNAEPNRYLSKTEPEKRVNPTEMHGDGSAVVYDKVPVPFDVAQAKNSDGFSVPPEALKGT